MVSRCSPVICAARRVSASARLRNTFNEYFGVGPIRLLKMRQLREIRAALLAADPVHETVASIAGRFGVWDFSLFARNYKRLFGESPSQTLRTPAGSCEHTQDVSWLGYAVRKFADDLVYAMPRSLAAAAVPYILARTNSSGPSTDRSTIPGVSSSCDSTSIWNVR